MEPLFNARKLTQENLDGIIELLFQKKIGEIRKIAKDPRTPALTAAMARCVHAAWLDGDWTNLGKILERTKIIGPVPRTVNANVVHTSLEELVAQANQDNPPPPPPEKEVESEVEDPAGGPFDDEEDLEMEDW